MKRVPLAEDDAGGGVLSKEWGSGLVHPRGVRPVLGEGGAPKGLAEADEDGPVAEAARRIGADPEEILAGAAAPETKEALKAATTEAVGRGVFGAPAFFVGDEMFWANDRLHFVEAALKKG